MVRRPYEWYDRFAHLAANSSRVFLAIESDRWNDPEGQLLVQERRGEDFVPYPGHVGGPNAIAADDWRLVIEQRGDDDFDQYYSLNYSLEVFWLDMTHAPGCGKR